MKSIEQQANPDVFIMITGCKMDLENQRNVSCNEGKQFAQCLIDNGHHAGFIEVSAKTGWKVNPLFNTVAVSTLKQIKKNMQQQQSDQFNINEDEQVSWWESSCC